MVKRKYTPEFIVNVVEEYLQSHETLKHVERKYKISRSLLRIWVLKYKYHGTWIYYDSTRKNADEYKEKMEKIVDENLEKGILKHCIGGLPPYEELEPWQKKLMDWKTQNKKGKRR